MIRVALLVLLLVAASQARAETYNFYFDTRSKQEVKVPERPKAESNFTRNRRWSTHASGFYGSRDSRAAGGLLAGLGFAVTETLRLSAFGGGAALAPAGAEQPRAFGGGDVQILPLHLPLGSSRRMADLGLAVGFNTFHRVGSNPGSLHLGPTVSARVSEPCSLVSSVRANLGSVLVDAGLSIRL